MMNCCRELPVKETIVMCFESARSARSFQLLQRGDDVCTALCIGEAKEHLRTRHQLAGILQLAIQRGCVSADAATAQGRRVIEVNDAAGAANHHAPMHGSK